MIYTVYRNFKFVVIYAFFSLNLPSQNFRVHKKMVFYRSAFTIPECLRPPISCNGNVSTTPKKDPTCTICCHNIVTLFGPVNISQLWKLYPSYIPPPSLWLKYLNISVHKYQSRPTMLDSAWWIYFFKNLICSCLGTC